MYDVKSFETQLNNIIYFQYEKDKVEVKSRQKPTNIKQARKQKVENIEKNQVPKHLSINFQELKS